MSPHRFKPLRNGQPLPQGELEELSMEAFRDGILQSVKDGQRLACLCACADLQVFAVLAEDQKNRLWVGRTRLQGASFPSLTPQCAQAQLFEREMAEQFGILPKGHPWLKPVRFHRPWSGQTPWSLGDPGVTQFFQVGGEEVHEVSVGPVHAGVIEPGHFRFQCHGETVFHLEIALGYQHRGVEKALLGGPHPLSLKQAETVAGDSSIAHGWAYCRNLEGLAGVLPPARSEWVRGVALELERAANHTGDLGAMAGDVGFLPSSSYCGRIRGDWLNLSAALCGSRLGRDLLKPGGLRQDLEPELARELAPRLAKVWEDTRDALELLWGASSVLNRFEAAGTLEPEQAREIGAVGVAARASGIPRDARIDHPFGPYGDHPVTIGMGERGRVLSRGWVRWKELQESHRFLTEALEGLAELPADPAPAPLPPLMPDALCVSLVEGWRGEVLHLAITDSRGSFARYKIVDPSFHNWFGLALALRGEQISDFPLINKSFNLSYCGHDL